MKEYQIKFLEEARKQFNDRPFITRKEATDLSRSLGNGLPHWFLTNYSVGRNQYTLDMNMAKSKKWGDHYRKPNIQSSVETVQEVRTEAETETVIHVESLVPEKEPNYIP